MSRPARLGITDHEDFVWIGHARKRLDNLALADISDVAWLQLESHWKGSLGCSFAGTFLAG